MKRPIQHDFDLGYYLQSCSLTGSEQLDLTFDQMSLNENYEYEELRKCCDERLVLQTKQCHELILKTTIRYRRYNKEIEEWGVYTDIKENILTFLNNDSVRMDEKLGLSQKIDSALLDVVALSDTVKSDFAKKTKRLK